MFRKLFCLVMLGLILSACGAKNLLPPKQLSMTIHVAADVNVNDGVLLPLDILFVENDKADAALAVGPDKWFGEDLRERLTNDEIRRLAIRSGDRKDVQISYPDSVKKIIIFADYENNNDRFGQQLLITPDNFKFKNSYHVNIHGNRMELVK